MFINESMTSYVEVNEAEIVDAICKGDYDHDPQNRGAEFWDGDFFAVLSDPEMMRMAVSEVIYMTTSDPWDVVWINGDLREEIVYTLAYEGRLDDLDEGIVEAFLEDGNELPTEEEIARHRKTA